MKKYSRESESHNYFYFVTILPLFECIHTHHKRTNALDFLSTLLGKQGTQNESFLHFVPGNFFIQILDFPLFLFSIDQPSTKL